MANHDRYEMDILKQLTKIANALERMERKMPDASKVYFGENLLGGLAIGYKKEESND